jgi:hypothetical protein
MTHVFEFVTVFASCSFFKVLAEVFSQPVGAYLCFNHQVCTAQIAIHSLLQVTTLSSTWHPNELPDIAPFLSCLCDSRGLSPTNEPNPQFLGTVVIFTQRPQHFVLCGNRCKSIGCDTIRAAGTTSDTAWVRRCNSGALEYVFAENIGGGEEVKVPLSTRDEINQYRVVYRQ